LITPSLDEMIHVAKEMEYRKLRLPLLIGGATTSRVHTAVKLAPAYNGPIVHVNDASRAVPVMSGFLGKDAELLAAKTRDEYTTLRELYLKRGDEKSYLSLDEARNRKTVLDFNASTCSTPRFVGSMAITDVTLADLEHYIDWTPYFKTWGLHGKFPDILRDEVVGEEATRVWNDTQALLRQFVDRNALRPKGVVGIFPAYARPSDEVVILNPDNPNEELTRFLFLRQQQAKHKDAHNRSLADFIAPESAGITDYIGAFAVTSGHELEDIVAAYRADLDDYHAIMAQALADRFAEAFAEYLHERVRKDLWGYAADEALSNDALIGEKYRGIRPAPGYPACPDHLEKTTIWSLLDVETLTGITLTESLAMYPQASVSGYYFAHPDAQYFGLGKIARDQVEDYAARRGIALAEAERWLSPLLNYQTETV
jgi:5-methyltetrahydrofolate--homocysteine methyltransferase